MNDREFANALLNLDASQRSPSEEIRIHTWKILQRDKWRVWILSGLTAVFWVCAAVTLYWGMISMVGVYVQVQEGHTPTTRELASSTYWFLLMLGGSVEGLMFALLFSFLTLIASRRATLRRINANLVELSDQLRRMAEPAAE